MNDHRHDTSVAMNLSSQLRCSKAFDPMQGEPNDLIGDGSEREQKEKRFTLLRGICRVIRWRTAYQALNEYQRFLLRSFEPAALEQDGLGDDDGFRSDARRNDAG